MHKKRDSENLLDRVILLFLFALFLLLSPLLDWWAADTSLWYSPYLIWGLLIGLTWLLQRKLSRHEL